MCFIKEGISKFLNGILFPVLFFSVLSCSPPQKHEVKSPPAPDKVPNREIILKKPNYSTGPAVEFTMGGMGMFYSVLYDGKKIIDTIDASAGYEYVGCDSIVYLPVKIWYDKDDGMCGIIRDYVLASGDKKAVLNQKLPFFDDYFSSPYIEDSIIYYWGIKRSDIESGSDDLYAVRYNFRLSKLDSVFVKSYLQAGTDDMDFYSIEPGNNGKLIFRIFNDGEWEPF